MTKRVLSMALALIMMLGCLAGITVSAEEAATEYTAALGFTDTNWSVATGFGNESTVKTTVTGAGSYTLSYDAAIPDAMVFVVDIVGAGEAFAAAGIKLTALSILVDGVEVPVDLSKVLTGDLEDNGNFRIDIYNVWGNTKDNPAIDNTAIVTTTNLTINFTLGTEEEPSVEPIGDFVAALGFTDTNWSVATGFGSESTVQTAVTGAGSYTLSYDAAIPDAMVFVVDIVGAGEAFAAAGIKLTALSILVDGVEVPVDLSKVLTGDLEDNGNFRIDIYNVWGSTKDDPAIDNTAIVTTTNLTINFTLAAEEAPVEPTGPAFDLFIAFGGDKAETNDWAYGYYGADIEGVTADRTTIYVGQTATVKLELASEPLNTYFFAPCLVADDVTWIGNIDFDVTCKINGQEVAIDMAADSQGRTWWTEGTGDYTAAQCIRLAGGYNQWGAQFVALPAEPVTSLEYTITLNAIEEAPDPSEGIESTEEYRLLLGFQGGRAAEAWDDLAYFGNAVEGITAVEATVKSGDTATISLTFAEPVGETWYFMPLLVGTGAGDQICAIDFDMVLKIDGVEVPINWEADAEGKTWWAEGTDSFIKEDCIRMGGGYNAFATQYVEKPTGFTTIEYTITFNSIRLAPEEEEPPVVEIDPMGQYNAYLMLQTPGWTFRNAWDDANYGINGTGWEAISNQWGNYLVHSDAAKAGMTWGNITDAVIAGNGTYSVKITDFGTLFADDFASGGQDYFNIIAISTDLPAGANVSITDVQLIVDGQVRHTYAEAYINEESGSYLQVLIQNIWNSDVKEISYYPAPSESLEIKFTISGFGYDQEGSDPVDPPVDPTVPDGTDPAETKPAESKPSETKPAETKPADPSEPAPKNNTTTIVIVVVAVVAVIAVVAVLVLKKKKA